MSASAKHLDEPQPSAEQTAGRVWVISELFYPEDTSTGYYLTRIAEALSTEQEVHVLCAQPTYAKRGTRVAQTETYKSIRIRRCRGTRWNKDVLPLRMINMLTITLSIFWNALWRFRRGDQVLVVTNPPLLPFVVQWAARIRGCRCVLLVHDVYPDVLTATGFLKANGWLCRIADFVMTRLYRRMNDIVVLGRDMQQLIEQKTGFADIQLHLITNWADNEILDTTIREQHNLRKRLNLENSFVVLYAGNIGRTHNMAAIVDAARELRSTQPDIRFLIVGFGAQKGWLTETVKQQNLTNVLVLDRLPREELPWLLNTGDIGIISFLPGMAGVSVPSRLYNLLAAGLPTLAIAKPASELALTIQEDQLGWIVPDTEPKQLASVINHAYQTRSERDAYVKRCLHAARCRFDFSHIAAQYRKLFSVHTTSELNVSLNKPTAEEHTSEPYREAA